MPASAASAASAVPSARRTGASLPARASRTRSVLAAIGCAGAVALGTAVAGPAAAAGLDGAGVRALMETTGVAGRMERTAGKFREQVTAGFAEKVAVGMIDPRQARVIERRADEVFAPVAFRVTVTDVVASSLGAGDAAAITAFHASPLGRRVVAEKRAHEIEDGGAAFVRFRQAFGSHPERDARRWRAMEMEKLLGTSYLAAEVDVALQLAVQVGMSIPDPTAARARFEAMLANARSQSAAKAISLHPTVVVYLAYAFENLSLAELDRVIAHHRTPEAARFEAALGEGLLAAIGEAGLAFGAGVAEAPERVAAGEGL